MQLHAIASPSLPQPVVRAAEPGPGERAATPRGKGPRAGVTDYGPIDALRGVELLRGLAAIVRERHVDRGYEAASDELFLRVDDTDGDDRVPDIYTGELRGPVTSSREEAWDLAMNVEHTWPRSLGARGPAKSDLHHLHTADAEANRVRDTHAYGEVVTPTWHTATGPTGEQSVLGVDALGQTVFEPAASARGDVARSLLYFYTRYSEDRQSRFDLGNFRRELPVLLRWHEADPVTDTERARNDAVERFQGNRNPYVDRPELVDRVGAAGFGGS